AALLLGSSLPCLASDVVFTCPVENANQPADWTQQPCLQIHLEGNLFFGWQPRSFITSDTTISAGHTEYKLLPVNAPLGHDAVLAMERLPFTLFQAALLLGSSLPCLASDVVFTCPVENANQPADWTQQPCLQIHLEGNLFFGWQPRSFITSDTTISAGHTEYKLLPVNAPLGHDAVLAMERLPFTLFQAAPLLGSSLPCLASDVVFTCPVENANQPADWTQQPCLQIHLEGNLFFGWQPRSFITSDTTISAGHTEYKLLPVNAPLGHDAVLAMERLPFTLFQAALLLGSSLPCLASDVVFTCPVENANQPADWTQQPCLQIHLEGNLFFGWQPRSFITSDTTISAGHTEYKLLPVNAPLGHDAVLAMERLPFTLFQAALLLGSSLPCLASDVVFTCPVENANQPADWTQQPCLQIHLEGNLFFGWQPRSFITSDTTISAGHTEYKLLPVNAPLGHDAVLAMERLPFTLFQAAPLLGSSLPCLASDVVFTCPVENANQPADWTQQPCLQIHLEGNLFFGWQPRSFITSDTTISAGHTEYKLLPVNAPLGHDAVLAMERLPFTLFQAALLLGSSLPCLASDVVFTCPVENANQPADWTQQPCLQIHLEGNLFFGWQPRSFITSDTTISAGHTEYKLLPVNAPLGHDAVLAMERLPFTLFQAALLLGSSLPCLASDVVFTCPVENANQPADWTQQPCLQIHLEGNLFFGWQPRSFITSDTTISAGHTEYKLLPVNAPLGHDAVLAMERLPFTLFQAALLLGSSLPCLASDVVFTCPVENANQPADWTQQPCLQIHLEGNLFFGWQPRSFITSDTTISAGHTEYKLLPVNAPLGHDAVLAMERLPFTLFQAALLLGSSLPCLASDVVFTCPVENANQPADWTQQPCLQIHLEGNLFFGWQPRSFITSDTTISAGHTEYKLLPVNAPLGHDAVLAMERLPFTLFQAALLLGSSLPCLASDVVFTCPVENANQPADWTQQPCLQIHLEGNLFFGWQPRSFITSDTTISAGHTEYKLLPVNAPLGHDAVLAMERLPFTLFQAALLLGSSLPCLASDVVFTCPVENANQPADWTQQPCLQIHLEGNLFFGWQPRSFITSDTTISAGHTEYKLLPVNAPLGHDAVLAMERLPFTLFQAALLLGSSLPCLASDVVFTCPVENANQPANWTQQPCLQIHLKGNLFFGWQPRSFITSDTTISAGHTEYKLLPVNAPLGHDAVLAMERLPFTLFQAALLLGSSLPCLASDVVFTCPVENANQPADWTQQPCLQIHLEGNLFFGWQPRSFITSDTTISAGHTEYKLLPVNAPLGHDAVLAMERLPFTLFQAALLLGSSLPCLASDVVFTCPVENANQPADWTQQPCLQIHLEGNLFFGWQPRSFITSDTTISAGHTEYKLLPVNAPLGHDAVLAMERLPFTLFQAALLLGSSLPCLASDVVFTCPVENANQPADWTQQPCLQIHLEGNLFFGWQPRSFITSDTTISAGHTEYKLLPVNAPLGHDAVLAMERLPFTLFQAALLLGSSLPCLASDVVFTCPVENANQPADWTQQPCLQIHLEGNLFFGWQPRSFITSDTTISAGHTEYKLLPVNAPLGHDAVLAMERLPFTLFQTRLARKKLIEFAKPQKVPYKLNVDKLRINDSVYVYDAATDTVKLSSA
ncbi:hypothetical protein V5799_031105, partial [Amblyomma americanum]